MSKKFALLETIEKIEGEETIERLTEEVARVLRREGDKKKTRKHAARIAEKAIETNIDHVTAGLFANIADSMECGSIGLAFWQDVRDLYHKHVAQEYKDRKVLG